MTQTDERAATEGLAAYYPFDLSQPDVVEDGVERWYGPATNFVIETLRGTQGGVVETSEHPDEFFVVLPPGSAQVRIMSEGAEGGTEEITAEENSVVIVPPGSSRLEFVSPGLVHRVLSCLSPVHAAARRFNRQAPGAADQVVPLSPAPAPPGGYALRTVPVYLKWTPTRTTPRPVGYVLPPSMASVVPKLLQHDIAVYAFRDSAQLDAEVYDATRVSRDSYFQGHYLKSVTGVEKKTETVQVPAGWFYVSTAQAKGHLISYILEPETDDNLITWGYTDNVLQVSPSSVEEAMSGLLGDNDLTLLPGEITALPLDAADAGAWERDR